MRNLSRLDPAPRQRHVVADGRRANGHAPTPPASRGRAPATLATLRRADRRHLVAVGLGIIGLGISLYLAATKLAPQDVTLYCSVSGPLDCQQVTSSPQSMLLGVPVPALGASWFVAWLGMVALSIWRPVSRLAKARLVWTAGGVGFVAYLVYSELFVIGSICEWCTSTHVIVLTLFGLTLWEVLQRRTVDRPVSSGLA